MTSPPGWRTSAGRSGAVEPQSPARVEHHPLEAFHRSLGHFAVTRHEALWYGVGRFSLATFPSNQRIAATRRDIRRLLVECRRLAAVFCPGVGSGVMVSEYRLRTKDYGPASLQPQFRRHVRRHGPGFVTRDLTWGEMAELCLPLHADLAERRGRGAARAYVDRRRWADACGVAAATPGLSAYGCLVDDALAGYVVDWREGAVRHGVMINRHTRFDPARSSNVLLHEFTRDRIGRTDTAEINLGRSWYPPKPTLNSFKRHAGYDESETTLAVVLHPRLESVLGSSWARAVLTRIGAIAGRWAGLRSDLDVVEAARLTDIP